MYIVKSELKKLDIRSYFHLSFNTTMIYFLNEMTHDTCLWTATL
jgi:hypothetical protein